jgi:hypothetical protein
VSLELICFDWQEAKLNVLDQCVKVDPVEFSRARGFQVVKSNLFKMRSETVSRRVSSAHCLLLRCLNNVTAILVVSILGVDSKSSGGLIKSSLVAALERRFSFDEACA